MSDDEVDSLLVPRRAARASAFAGLADSSSDEDEKDSTPTPAPAAAPTPTPTPSSSSSKATTGGGKGGKGGGGKKVAAATDDDDWEILLEAEKAVAAAKAAAAPAVDASVSTATAAAAAVETEDTKKKRKKKKKAGDAGGKDDGDEAGESEVVPTATTTTTTTTAAAAPVAKAAAPVSKAAQAALERKRLVAEEEARVAAVNAASEAAYRAEVAAVEADEKKRTDAKARKVEDRRLKKEKAIRNGTYRTKKQIEEAIKHVARLDAMKAAGIVIEGFDEQRAAAAAAAAFGSGGGGGESDDEGEGGDAAPAVPIVKVKVSSLYDSRKKKPESKSASIPVTTATTAPATGPAVMADSWEAEIGGGGGEVDSWETAADDAEAKAAQVAAVKAAAIVKSIPASSVRSGGGGGGGGVGSSGVGEGGSGGIKTLAERIRASRVRRDLRIAEADSRRSADRLRSPICVVLGHVDTGKTSLLDKIRRTNVQEGEAGGITQQIGATFFPMEALKPSTDKLNKELNLEYRVPGLLVIDTPGHEQFTNLRNRGSSLCDIAVLVVDIMVGLERQTLESLQLLRSRKTPFIIALNKVDRMYGWKGVPNSPIRESLATQPDYAVEEFERRTSFVLGQIMGEGLNAKLYYENDDFRRVVSVVPTSAFTGEGVPDLLMLLVQLTQQLMAHRLMLSDVPQATVLEVKSIDGLGTTVDIVLTNGEIKEGDTIVACGMNGPIVTQIRALLTPPVMREMRVKSEYVHHKAIGAAMGVKIVAADMENAVAGTELFIAHPDDEIEHLKQEVMEDFEKIMTGFKRESVGVYVQASTLGSLEALLEYLRTHNPPVPVAQVGIGPLHRKDVIQASVMLEKRKEYASMLCFDVKITPEAEAAAESLGVRIFRADIIYHLTDQFSKYLADIVAKKQAAAATEAVFPAIAKIIPTAVFNKKDPIVVGIDVLEGRLKVGTPLCVVLPADKVVTAGGLGEGTLSASGKRGGPNILAIGRVAGLEINHVAVQEALPGGPSVSCKIEQSDAQKAIMYGRHFDHTQLLYAHVSRGSIDCLKNNFRDSMKTNDWKVLVKLKDALGVE